MKKRKLTAPPALEPQEVFSCLEEAAAELRAPVTVGKLRTLLQEKTGAETSLEVLRCAVVKSSRFAQTRSCRFVTREVLLNGAHLRIEPTGQELSEGILIPGHRFLPLWWGQRAESLVARDQHGNQFSTQELKMSFAEAFPYHYLLGYNWIPEFVVDSGPESFGEQFALGVFRLREFYAACGFQPGDFLLVRIDDPWNGEFTLRHETRREVLRNVAAIRASEVALEKAFLAVLEKPEVMWSLPEQLFQALAHAPAFVRSKPTSPWEHFLGRASSFSIQEVGLDIAAFPKGTSPFELAARRSMSEKGEPDFFSDPLDQLLGKLGINLRGGSLRGLLRLAAHEGTDVAAALDGIVPWKRLKHAAAPDIRSLRRRLKELWAEASLREAQAPLGEDMAALLRRAAALKRSVLRILRHLDSLSVPAGKLPSRPLLRMVEIDELAECILQLNIDSEGNFAKAAELGRLMAEVEKHLLLLQEEILHETLVQ